MNRVLLSSISTLLFPLAAHAALTPAGEYLMRDGDQPDRYARIQLDVSSRTMERLQSAKPHQIAAARNAVALDIVQPQAITELVVIDGAVADKATLYRGLRPGVAAVEIDSSQPGLPQLADALRNYRNLAAIHVVSHAEAGMLLLGSSRITAESVKGEMESLAVLRQAVRSGGDLLFYGCDLAADERGERLLDIVQRQTGLDVAASSNPTGNPALGGDWTLEIQRGDIDTPLAFSDKARADFSEVLVASNGLKDFAGWISTGLNPDGSGWSEELSSTDFRLTAKSGSDETRVVGVFGNTAYIMNNAANDNLNHYLYVKADGTNTTAFELTGLNAGEYLSGEFTNLRVVGMVHGGGMIQSATVNSVGASGESFAFGPDQLSGFAGLRLQGFKLYFDCEGTCSQNETANLEFRNFTIANAVNTPAIPRVNDAHISISGATGTGGAYKVGDTVTATWNNSATGDNNSSVNSVTVDFSQFGGGAAVAATNAGGVWTATYTIVAGAIDTINRNISVTATNGGGSTTTADTTNATVDSIAPVVTSANISITGATGMGGVFRIGNTVTARWDNTAAGDNNSDTIASVDMNLGEFGGGSNVAATNASGVWTASYTIVEGSISDMDARVSVVATDNAGNQTTTSSPSAMVDSSRPTVTSIAPAGSPVSTSTSVNFTVNFNKAVANISTDDFTLVSTSSASGTISSVSTSSGSSVTVTVSGITGNGSIKVSLNAGTNIVDSVGNAPPAYTGGTTHTVAIPTAPDAPTIGAATPGDGQVSVAFAAPGNNGGSAITGYTVISSPGGITAAGTTSPITVTGLTNGTAYTFTVVATNAAGTSTASGASGSATPKGDQTITFAQPPSYNYGTTPTLSATATSGLPVIFGSVTTGVCTIDSSGVLSFTTVGLCSINANQPGNNAWNAATTVPRSFNVNAIVPGAPTIGTATAGNAQASVSFTAPASSGGSSITQYTATSSPGGFTGTGASTPITVTGLTNGTAYTFTVTATTSAGTGSASAPSNAVTPKSTQSISFANPGAQIFGSTPALLATTSAGSSYPVTFTSSTTSVCTITSTGTLTFVSAGTCTINADQPGDGTVSAAPQVSQSFTVNAVAPGAPTIGTATATAGNGQASVNFTAPASSGGATITGYTATSNPGGIMGTGTSTPITVTGLTNGTAYTFTVTATTSAGTGSASAASNSVTPRSTQTISFAQPVDYSFGATPTLTATSSAGGGYTVGFTSATTGVCTITPAGALTFVAAGLCTINADQPGDAAVNAAPQVPRSFNVHAAAPDAPTIGAVTAGDTQATVNFTAPAATGGAPISGYTVTATPVWVAGAPGVTTQTGTASPIVVTGLSNGFVYGFKVTASNGAQSSADSAVRQATPRKLELGGAAGSVPGMTGVPTATLSGGGATCTLLPGGGFGPAATTPPGVQAPHGQFAFDAEKCTGSVTLTLSYPSPLPVGVQFRKPNGTGGWFNPRDAATSLNVVMNAARTTVSYTITDNGLGDTNPATGLISDPLVPVVVPMAAGTTHAIPTLGAWPLAMLSALMGGLALYRRRLLKSRS